MPETKTYVEFTNTWPALKNNGNVHTKKYEMMVEQDDTEVLINLILKHHYGIYTSFRIFFELDQAIKLTHIFLNQKSFRANLKNGKYCVQVKMRGINENGGSELSSNYLENGGNDFLFRLAASKQCSVKKRVVKETENQQRKGFLTSFIEEHMGKFVFINSDS